MRSVSGFSLGTSLEHYRCYNVHVTSTMAKRISDQVHFRHKYITVPTMSPESYVVEAAQKLTAALKGNIPASSETAVGLTKLGELFNNIATAKAAAAAEQLERANDRRAIQNASNTIGNCTSSKGGCTSSKGGCGDPHGDGTSSKGADTNYLRTTYLRTALRTNYLRTA